VAADGERRQTYRLVVTARGLVAELVRDEATGEWGVARRLALRQSIQQFGCCIS